MRARGEEARRERRGDPVLATRVLVPVAIVAALAVVASGFGARFGAWDIGPRSRSCAGARTSRCDRGASRSRRRS
jgi:hypothetical protein